MYKITTKQGQNYFRNNAVTSPIPPTDTPERKFVQHTKVLGFWVIDNILIYKQHIKFNNKNERPFKLNHIKKINLFMKQRKSKASKLSKKRNPVTICDSGGEILKPLFC